MVCRNERNDDPRVCRVDDGDAVVSAKLREGLFGEDERIDARAIDDDDETVEIVHADGKTEQATVVGHDGSTDLALLRSERAASVVLAHAPNDDLRVGALALALARDDDGDLAATMGVISALGTAWRTWRGGELDRFIRPDVAISPRFSGGPLIDVHGRIVGMNTWGLSRRNAPTVPASTIARVVESLASGKRVSRGYLGIAMQSLELPQALAEIAKVAVGGGVPVVVPFTAADAAPSAPLESAALTVQL